MAEARPLITGPRAVSSGVPRCRDKVAVKKLKQYNWNLDAAVESYLLEGGTTGGPVAKVDKAKLTALFEKYKGR